jgi:predicted acetyltransferase
MSYYSIKNYVDNMKFSENDIIVAFVENNNIIAMCELLTSDNNILTGKKTGDVGILVDRSHRNRGLGKKLFGYCVEKALNNNVKVIRSHCMSTNTWMIRICKDYNVNIAQYGSETVAILNDTIF